MKKEVNIFPIIKTNNLLLRRFVESDLENVFSGLSDPEVIKYYGVSYNSLFDTKEQLRYFSDLEQNETGIWWAVCSADGTVFYGACGFNNLIKIHMKTEIGFWLLRDFWNKGIMSEAIPLICEYALKGLGLHRIEAFVETENFNCKKVLDKLKFIHEGTMKDCEFKNSKFISLDIYARIISPK